jgi:prepilin-type N-terminal cleavage/methylation domain-containing protein
MRHSHAFTLIELLVVIAIISIVAAILFPVFASAKGAAKRASALSNQNQIGIALHLYLNDYEDSLPFRFPDIAQWPGYNAVLFVNGPGLTDKFQPYLKDSEV